jgi:iron complex transport system substrate-binding protein
MSVNIEVIVSMNPDYVFSSGSESSPSNVRLRNAGLRLVILNAESVEEAMSNVLRLGELLNRRPQAQKVVLSMEERLDKIKNKADKIKIKKKVYVEIWGDPITSAGRGSLVNEVVTMAGGINIAGGLDMLYPALSPEFVIQSDPDCILIGYMSRNQELIKNAVLKRMGWQDIKAVRLKNIICDIDPDIFLRPGPRIADGIEAIYRRLYENG